MTRRGKSSSNGRERRPWFDLCICVSGDGVQLRLSSSIVSLLLSRFLPGFTPGR